MSKNALVDKEIEIEKEKEVNCGKGCRSNMMMIYFCLNRTISMEDHQNHHVEKCLSAGLVHYGAEN